MKKSKGHICIFSAQYLPHMGGVENYTYNLSKSLISKGYRVTVVTSNTNNWNTKETVDGISIIRFPVFNFIQGRYPIIKTNHCFRQLKKEIYSADYDFIIVNARFYIHSVFGLKMAYKRQIPSICIDHGTSHLTVNNKILDTIGGAYEHFITMIDKAYCKDFYAVSPTSLKWLEHFHIKGKGILYNSIDPESISKYQHEKGDAYRERFYLNQETIMLTFTGRLLPEKGVLQLISAVDRLVDEGVDIQLFIAGEGPLVISGHSDKVHLLGRISFEHIIHLLVESDIFILPSDSEGFSTSILEAGVCNCYIIANDTGGIHEVLKNDEYGIVMNNNREIDIYHAIKKAINNKNQWKNAEDKTEKNILKNFIWDKTANDVVGIHKQMTK